MRTQFSDGSMVSIDPAIAKEILGYANESVFRDSTSSEASTVKTNAPGSHHQENQAQIHPLRHKEPLRRPEPKTVGRARNNSLKHVKNSNELLRQRSKAKKVSPLDALSESGTSTRGGRQFTVGNVGNNGMLYLRPVPAPSPPKPAQDVFVSPQTPQVPDPERTPTADPRESTWSTSNYSKHVQKPAPPTSFPLAKLPQGHSRARSYSTVDDQRSNESREGVLKIVIDRTKDSRPKSAENGVPTLDVPIPTYKLGTPRFSAHGTPGWRSSVYTRSSVSNHRASSIMRPDFDTLFPAPPHLRSRNPTFLLPPRQPSEAFSSVTRSSAALPSPGIYSVKEPIEPTIFDTLATCMDDATVVRYSPKTGEITAATPARIIAQISSEVFMDYELVSDFFLTYRSYLSSENVLNLILARLRWAINRFQDDGRIIRIRAFAALRHWILNYFMDDFVIDRSLRVRFCDQINAMYHEVKARQYGGTSDLKIILDLKRCWNGRCSMFWDSEMFNLDTQQDADIVPGGVEDEQGLGVGGTIQRRSSFVNSEYEDAYQQAQTKGSGTWIDMSREPDVAQQSSTLHHTEGPPVPLSPTSELSIQPLSCSIPARTLRRSPPQGEKPLGPHPVLLESIKPASTPVTPKRTMQRPSHAHKRSGSFTDTIRDDRAPLENSADNHVSIPLHSGSLIRGQQFAPGDALVDVIAPTSPIAELAQFDLTQLEAEFGNDAAMRSNSALTPGMKTLIGSIRRALSSKQGSSLPSRSANETISDLSLRGKTSTLPLNVAFFNETMREKKNAPVYRRHVRIDLLCAEVHESYQTAISQGLQGSPSLTQGIGIASGNEAEQPSPVEDVGVENGSTLPFPTTRPSQLTPGSRSIVIVDDTGYTMPAMSGALPLEPASIIKLDGQDAGLEQLPRQAYRVFSEYSTNRRSSGIFGTQRATSLGWREPVADKVEDSSPQDATSAAKPRTSLGTRSLSVESGLRRRRSLHSMSLTLRRYASYHGSMSKRVADPGLDHTTTTVSGSQDSPDHQPPRLLRRRPGGDLKKFQNVHDLEPMVRRHSTGSIDGRTDSAAGSMLLVGANSKTDVRGSLQSAHKTSRNFQPKPVSLMHTHSSTRMRPSFEAVVKNFSEIPDDEDGGLEATLLKLEGRYEPRSPDLSERTHDSLPATVGAPETEATEATEDLEQLTPRKYSQPFTHGNSELLKPEPSPQARLRASITRRLSPLFGLGAPSMTGSDESYSSIPLLERGLHDSSMQKPRLPMNVTEISPHYSEGTTQNEADRSDSSHASIEMVEETDSMKRIPRGSVLPEKVSQNTSFLLDGDDHLSDLSSEISVDIIDPAEVQPRALSPLVAPPGTALSGLQVPTHPLAHPPTPPFSDSTFRFPVAQTDPLRVHQELPPTPDPSPTFGQNANSLGKREDTSKDKPKAVPTVSPNLGHVPFILACDSEMLAQQFTIVEKAALSEIDWNDLVDLKWDNRSPNVLNWVSYLMEKDHKGIDLVICRFNLMVKWTMSEVVMTQDVQERARTITKYIHIAAQARRLRNYATMMQMVIGLTSTDCSRLTKTWELVPTGEKQILKDMELLSQPLRNFHALREEMESTNLQEGCIPFVGKS